MKKPAVIESMTQFTIQGLTCRVWREEDRLQAWYDNHDLIEAAQELGPGHTTVATMAELLARRSRVNAVEVRDAQGAGVVIYPEWP